jgi:hypothetical protein
MYDVDCDTEIDSSEPPNPDRDKFKVPRNKRNSAFAPVLPKTEYGPKAVEKAVEGPYRNAYDYKLKNASSSLADIAHGDKSTSPTQKDIATMTGDTNLPNPVKLGLNGHANAVSLDDLISAGLQNHPVIVELVKQAREKKFPKCSFYIPIDFINNYQY